MNPTIRSLLFKFAYGFVAALAAAFLGWVQANPDPVSWTLVSLKFALLTAAAGAVKKFFASFLA